MTARAKNIRLIFLLGALAALVLLASSLSNLQLLPGTSFPANTSSEEITAPQLAVLVFETYPLPILRGILTVAFVATVVYLVARIVHAADRKTLLRLVLMGVFLLVLIILSPLLPLSKIGLAPSEGFEFHSPPSLTYPQVLLGNPPPFLIWLVIFGCVLAIAIPAAIIIRGRLEAPQAEADLLQEAKDAVETLEAGGELRAVILRCYFQMTQTVKEEQGLERNYTMTAREFERWLATMGFPPGPVHRLTDLFEKARYGAEELGEKDEKIALESLNAIIGFSRTKGTVNS